MQNDVQFKHVVISAFFFTVFIFHPATGWAYGGGGEGTGQNQGTGASFNSSHVHDFFPYAANVTDHASFEQKFNQIEERRDAEIKRHRERRNYIIGDDIDYYNDILEGLLVVSVAWDETLNVPPNVRRLAMFLESMMVSGSITPRHAFTLILIYRIGQEKR